MARGRGSMLRHWAAIIGLLAFAISAGGEAADAVLAAEVGTIDPSLAPPERVRALGALATRLVALAGSSKADATSFRIDVAHYRESLRDLVKENGARAEPARLPQPLLMDLVRMAGLLQSAAECQTGRYIVCPPDLMTRLRRQQGVVEGGVGSLQATR